MTQLNVLPIVRGFDAEPFVAGEEAVTLAVYVPSRGQDGYELGAHSHATWVSLVARALCDVCGGCTAVPATGFWVNPETRELVEENTVVLTAFVARAALVAGIGRIRYVLYQFGKETNQHTVAFTLNGEFFGIDPRKPY